MSFAVVFDESQVKLSRTTREEFLANLAYAIKVDGQSLTRADVESMVAEFGAAKALEVEPAEFLRGYFSVGLLHDSSGCVRFSVPYVEAYLLAELLRKRPEAAHAYFDPKVANFDQFSFDLYVERGASSDVIENIISFANSVVEECDSDNNVFLAKQVRPRALATTRALLSFAEKVSAAVTTMSSVSASQETRMEKQRLLDARAAVREEVASRDDQSRSETPVEKKAEFEQLDRLSIASTLLATAIGSGAERLEGKQKLAIAGLILPVFERFLHLWTKDRLAVGFDDVRAELLSKEAIDKLIEEHGLYAGDREDITETLSTFIDDQEMRLLSGPAGSLFARLAQYAGVRSLKPIFSTMKPSNDMEKIFRDVWLMEVEHSEGKRDLKDDLRNYKGSELLRLVITNHLMYRVFWHHWQTDSKSSFIDVAKYALKPMGVTTADEHTRRMLAGSRAELR